MDEFHLWAGHLLVPVDRSNASGPFFMMPWNYPGFFTARRERQRRRAPGGRAVRTQQRRRRLGRHRGGKFRYFAGAFDNGNARQQPAVLGQAAPRAARIRSRASGATAATSATRTSLSIGLGAQYQKHGSATPTGDKDWAEINVDGSSRRSSAADRFVTGEGAYYHYNVNDGRRQRHVLRARRVRHPDGRRRQASSRWSAIQWEKIKASRRHEAVEHRRRRVLPDQGPGAPASSRPTATRISRRPARRAPARAPTPSSSARRRSSSRFDLPNTRRRD